MNPVPKIYKTPFSLFARHREAFLFLILLFLIFIQTFSLLWARRLVIHDTLFDFTAKYYFLNNAVFTNEIPQWVPYLTHGVPSAFWYGIHGTGGILTNTLMHMAGLIRQINFLVIYYWEIYFEQVILLTGVWLLARRYYASCWTRFFVAVSILGTNVWTDQIGLNFHSYYALPFLLHFLHEFLDSGRWRYFSCVMSLFVLQSLSNAAYFISMVGLIMFLYFSAYAAFQWKEFWKKLRNIRAVGMDWIWILLSGFLFCALCVFLFLAHQYLTWNLAGRDASLSVALHTYLNYAVSHYPLRWLELLLGFSVARDYTLYAGVFVLP